MPQAKIVAMRGRTKPERMTRTTVDTICFTRDQATSWIIDHEIQRQLTVNAKVKALAEELRANGGVIPDVIELAIVKGKTYLLDGQHRIAAFMLSGLDEGYADVVTRYFETEAELGPAFVQRNMQLVRLRPDDVIRAYAKSSPQLTRIRQRCSFVSFDVIPRTSDRTACLSMASLIRSWRASQLHSPAPPRMNAMDMAQTLTDADVDAVVDFLELCDSAWGRDVAYGRLWAMLNLTLCAWLYRRIVLARYSPRVQLLTPEQFRQCLIAVGANRSYVDWLRSRTLTDRSPAYSRLKLIFAKRLGELLNGVIVLPQPEWAANATTRGGR